MAQADKSRQLSTEQQNAIDLLVLGKTDAEVGEAVGVSRQTVNGWRNHDAAFLAALNRERAAVWQAGRDSLAALAGQAIAVLEAGLSSTDSRVAMTAAAHVLKAAGVYGERFTPGATDADEIEAGWKYTETMRLLNAAICG